MTPKKPRTLDDFVIVGNKPKVSPSIPLFVRRAVTFLDASPDNQLYTTNELVERLGYSSNNKGFATHSLLSRYRIAWNCKRILWGNPRAVEAAAEILKRTL